MSQVVLGAALGCILGQGVLYSLNVFLGWLKRKELRNELVPVRGTAILAGFIKYAGVLGACGALITLGVWTLEDHMATSSGSRPVKAEVISPSTPPPLTPAENHWDDGAALDRKANASTAVIDIDPYADTEFKVRHVPRRKGSPANLKETLLQRSEATARADLLKQTQQHANRSQYDCEAAGRATKYLEADLDVWGFTAWQVKYFPTAAYKGAKAPPCTDIENVVDPSVAFAINRRG
jgi:hypothetical protein